MIARWKRELEDGDSTNHIEIDGDLLKLVHWQCHGRVSCKLITVRIPILIYNLCHQGNPGPVLSRVTTQTAWLVRVSCNVQVQVILLTTRFLLLHPCLRNASETYISWKCEVHPVLSFLPSRAYITTYIVFARGPVCFWRFLSVPFVSPERLAFEPICVQVPLWNAFRLMRFHHIGLGLPSLSLQSEVAVWCRQTPSSWRRVLWAWVRIITKMYEHHFS